MALNDRKDNLESTIRQLIGDEAYVKFVEAFRGRRLFLSGGQRNEVTKVAAVIGEDAARRLWDYFGADYIRVPVSRSFLAQVYRRRGLSNGEIATQLGMTEPGVNSLFRRLRHSASPQTSKANKGRDRSVKLVRAAGER